MFGPRGKYPSQAPDNQRRGPGPLPSARPRSHRQLPARRGRRPDEEDLRRRRIPRHAPHFNHRRRRRQPRTPRPLHRRSRPPRHPRGVPHPGSLHRQRRHDRRRRLAPPSKRRLRPAGTLRRPVAGVGQVMNRARPSPSLMRRFRHFHSPFIWRTMYARRGICLSREEKSIGFIYAHRSAMCLPSAGRLRLPGSASAHSSWRAPRSAPSAHWRTKGISCVPASNGAPSPRRWIGRPTAFPSWKSYYGSLPSLNGLEPHSVPLSPVEALARSHDLTHFDCGSHASLNDWLKRFAWVSQQSETSRTYVVHRAGRVVAYYSIATGSARREDAPPCVARGLAGHPVPIILLTRLAVDITEQGAGLGESLLTP